MYTKEWKEFTFKLITGKLKNNQIIDVTLKGNLYSIELPIKTDSLNDLDEYYFTLEKRGYEDLIYMNATVIDKIEEYMIFNLSFSFEEYKQMLSQNEILDLYINLKVDNEVKRRRIKSNQDNLRIFAIVLPKQEKMFYPYTTKNGNLSFRLNTYHLFADFEEVHIRQENIAFSGYFIYPPMFKEDGYKVINKKLIVTNNIDDNEIQIELEDVQRLDVYNEVNGNELLKEISFKGKFNIRDNTVMEQKVYYKFYFELTYERNNLVEIIRSTRMRVNQQKVDSQSKILGSQNGKIKIMAKPTKKSKFLSIQVSKYNFKDEIVQTIRSKWIKLRRSK